MTILSRSLDKPLLAQTAPPVISSRPRPASIAAPAP